MQIKLTLALPRDQLSIPVVRRLCTQSLRVLGAREECQTDLEVALTEACTNVLDHAGPTDDYEVIVEITDEKVAIQIVDAGAGFDSSLVAQGAADSPPDAEAERGRGIQLMRALTDRLTFTARPEHGTVVHMEKDLLWERDAPIHRLTGSTTAKAASSAWPAPPAPR